MITLTWLTVLAVFVFAFVAGVGYSAGCWLWAALVAAVRRKP